MKVDTYNSVKNSSKMLTVPTGTDIAKMTFPEDIDPDLLDLSLLHGDIDIFPGDKRVAFDSRDIISQIEKKGHATHGVQITMTTTIAGKEY